MVKVNILILFLILEESIQSFAIMYITCGFSDSLYRMRKFPFIPSLLPLWPLFSCVYSQHSHQNGPFKVLVLLCHYSIQNRLTVSHLNHITGLQRPARSYRAWLPITFHLLSYHSLSCQFHSSDNGHLNVPRTR